MSPLLTLLASFALTRLLAPALADENAAAATATDSPPMHAPTVLSHRTDEAIALLAGVRTTLDEQLSGTDRRRFGRKVLSASRVSMTHGAFPSGGTTVVTVNVPLRAKDPLAAPRFISGVFTLDDGGALASMVVAPKMQTQRFDLARIGDLDGDGFDDLELAITGDGSDERRTVHWADGAPVSGASATSDANRP
jgi:hypothetical protein